MKTMIDTRRIEDYRKFLAIRTMPTYRFGGCIAHFPDQYASMLGTVPESLSQSEFAGAEFLFDYQRDIAEIAFDRRKFCVFADCGLGKTLLFLEFVRNAIRSLPKRKKALIVSPHMVIPQTIDESLRWYNGELEIDLVPSNGVEEWLRGDFGRIGITNYEAFNERVDRGDLGCLIIDESSMLKSHYGKWAGNLIALGRGVEFKLACTGTPAPNDRIEYANHAVLMDAFPTVNSFLARYFINRGQTGERWELKPHAIGAFYRDLSHWSIFLTNPGTYGWKDQSTPLPPIHVHIEHVGLTDDQRDAAQQQTGDLFVHNLGGITSRSKLATISKGFVGTQLVETKKITFIRDRLVATWPKESTLIWCIYNEEQRLLREAMPNAMSMDGDTPYEKRLEMIGDFRSGKRKTLIAKSKILGFGLNLQIATRHVFSGLQDSYESYYQCIKRSNRYGAERSLNVHIPITEIERPMVETVLSKARRVQQDTEEQERIFKANAPFWRNVNARG